MKNYEDIKIEIAEGETKEINYYVLIISFDLMDENFELFHIIKLYLAIFLCFERVRSFRPLDQS